MVASSPQLYQPETLRRIRSGEHVIEANYQRALQTLQDERREIANRFEATDVFVTPTTPGLAPRISDLMSDPSRLRSTELVLLRNTRPVNANSS